MSAFFGFAGWSLFGVAARGSLSLPFALGVAGSAVASAPVGLVLVSAEGLAAVAAGVTGCAGAAVVEACWACADVPRASTPTAPASIAIFIISNLSLQKMELAYKGLQINSRGCRQAVVASGFAVHSVRR